MISYPHRAEVSRRSRKIRVRGGKANNRSNADISTEGAMISLTKAKKILNKGKRAYDDEQVKEILRTLEIMAEQQIITEKYKEEKYYGQND